MTVRGRFAPTPNGPLHLGSVVAAVASHLSARHRGGEWHVRIDDVDVGRAVPGAADAILGELERLALPWDGPVVHQRDNTERYRAALALLERGGWTFGCACTRREAGPGPYPGTCRGGTPRPARSVRMRADARIAFRDAVQGEVVIDLPAETGDFIVYPGRPRPRLSPGRGGGRRSARGHRDRARRRPPRLHRTAGPRPARPRPPHPRLGARADRHHRGRRQAREELGRATERGAAGRGGAPERPPVPRSPSAARGSTTRPDSSAGGPGTGTSPGCRASGRRPQRS